MRLRTSVYRSVNGGPVFLLRTILHSSFALFFPNFALYLYFVHVTLFSRCTFSVLRSFRDPLSLFSILFMLHFFPVALFVRCELFSFCTFLCCTLFMLYFFFTLHFLLVALFPCCTLFMFYLHFTFFTLFVFHSCFTFFVLHLFLMNFLHVSALLCCTIFMLRFLRVTLSCVNFLEKVIYRKLRSNSLFHVQYKTRKLEILLKHLLSSSTSYQFFSNTQIKCECFPNML